MAPDSLTVTLTGRPPAKITKALWPLIASSRDWDDQHESQATRTWKLYVRQHSDGRTLVYGTHTTRWQGERDRRGGELLAAGEDVAAAILRVGDLIGADQPVIDACVADLPAVDIDQPTEGDPRE